MHPDIPEPHRDAVEAALRAVLGQAPVTGCERLAGGMSSALVFRVGGGGRDYLLRLCVNVDALTAPERHFACLATASQAGIAPPLRYASARDGLSISDFIAARPFAEHPGGRPAMLAELAGAIGVLQATAPFPPLVGFLDGVEAMIGAVQASGVATPAALEAPLAAYGLIQRAYPRDTPLVSSHNDLNPGNILFDGRRLWLVDWEAAFANDRFVDPALAAHWFRASPQEAEALLAIAQGRPLDPDDRARLAMMRQVVRMYYAMIFLQLVAAEAPEPGVADLAAPPLAEVMTAIAEGRLPLASRAGRITYAKASLAAIVEDARGAAFGEALRLSAA
jgi:hypothetical protein